jgi:hypothetical protein
MLPHHSDGIAEDAPVAASIITDAFATDAAEAFAFIQGSGGSAIVIDVVISTVAA